MIPSILRSQIIRKFAKNKKLTIFQKERLIFLIAMIRVSYEIGLRFSEYIKGYQADIEAFINDLDSKSKNEVKTILRDIEFMHAHAIIKTVMNFISKEDKVFEHMNAIQSIKDKYNLPMDFYQESVYTYKHGLKFIPQNIIKSLNNKDFLDCGGFIGGSALMFEMDYTPNKIYSFEPILDNYSLLLENIKTNNLRKVIPINKGVGKKSCTVNIYSLGSASYVSDEDGDTEIEVISIDEFVSERNLSVGLIKMDVEGYELEALKGAKRTIKEFKPVLLIGIYHNPEEFFGTKKYIQSLVPGYKFKIKHLDDIVPLHETHLIAW